MILTAGTKIGIAWGNTLVCKQKSFNFDILYPSDHTYIPSQINHQSSTLDPFITNVSQHISLPEVINGLGSDHLPVNCQLMSQAIKSKVIEILGKPNGPYSPNL